MADKGDDQPESEKRNAPQSARQRTGRFLLDLDSRSSSRTSKSAAEVWASAMAPVFENSALRDIVKPASTFDQTEKFARSVLSVSGTAKLFEQFGAVAASQSGAAQMAEQIKAITASQSNVLRLTESFRGFPGFDGIGGFGGQPLIEKFGSDLVKQFSAFTVFNSLASNSQLANLISTRLNGLQLGLAKQIGGAAAFGRLDATMRAMPNLGNAIDHAIRATQRPGPVGFNYAEVYRALVQVDDLLADPHVEADLTDPINEVQQAAGLDNDDIIRMPDLLGFVRRARTLRLSTFGLFCGVTVGSTYWVTKLIAGESWPEATTDAVVLGGGIYEAARRLGDH